ncbi:MAG: PilT/PilU family type 4a pilus ATPase [Acidimicrobiales bacterium]|nr:PilT/PilU family type 4a pilus ATPase [Acidimicrobiales bacterium]
MTKAQLLPEGADRHTVHNDIDEDWRTLDDDGRAFLADALAGTGEPTDGRLTELLDAALAADASDLHLSAGTVPHVRVRGELRPLAGSTPLAAADLATMLNAPLSLDQRQLLSARGDLDTALDLSGTNPGNRRFRASIFRQSGSLAAAIRLVPDTIPALDDLGLPAAVRRFTALTSGLVLVTGPTGSGKSTTLASMIQEINQSTRSHIVTIEDPIEYRHVPLQSVIQQREVGGDTESYVAALRGALRQDPDVILIGELRDLDTIRVALTAAETGHVVFATLHSSDATSAVNRIIDVFPGDQQAQIRSQLALSLEGSISQRLVPSTSESLVPATEVMTATSAVRNLIRSDKVHQLPSILETGGDDGMHTFDQSLAGLVRRGAVDPLVARTVASSAANLESLMGR